MNANLHQPAMLMPSPDSAPQSNPGFSRMFARDQKSLPDFFIVGEADGYAAPVIAVVGLGDHGKSHALRRAHRLSFGLHQFLLRYRQA